MKTKGPLTMGITGGFALCFVLLGFVLHLWLAGVLALQWHLGGPNSSGPNTWDAPSNTALLCVAVAICLTPLCLVVLAFKKPLPQIFGILAGISLATFGGHLIYQNFTADQLSDPMTTVGLIYAVPGALAALLYLLPWSKPRPKFTPADVVTVPEKKKELATVG